MSRAQQHHKKRPRQPIARRRTPSNADSAASRADSFSFDATTDDSPLEIEHSIGFEQPDEGGGAPVEPQRGHS